MLFRTDMISPETEEAVVKYCERGNALNVKYSVSAIPCSIAKDRITLNRRINARKLRTHKNNKKQLLFARIHTWYYSGI